MVPCRIDSSFPFPSLKFGLPLSGFNVDFSQSVTFTCVACAVVHKKDASTKIEIAQALIVRDESKNRPFPFDARKRTDTDTRVLFPGQLEQRILH